MYVLKVIVFIVYCGKDAQYNRHFFGLYLGFRASCSLYFAFYVFHDFCSKQNKLNKWKLIAQNQLQLKELKTAPAM